MADRAAIEATIDRYYEAWTNHDHELYRTVWAEGATFADPPRDDVTPPTGFDEIVAGMDDVWSRATAITYDHHMRWHCESVVAVHMTVTMATTEGSTLAVPLIHVFRFDDGALVTRLEAFLDLSLAQAVDGDRPAWVDTYP